MLPEIPKLAGFDHFAWFCSLQEGKFDLLTLCKIEGAIPSLPDQYTPPTYAIEFVVRGHTTGMVNGNVVELHPNDAFFIKADSVHENASVSPDCEIYLMGFTVQFAEMLNLHLPQAQFSQLLMRPTWQLTDQQLFTVLKYFELLRILIEANRTTEVLHLVRSLLYNLAEDYALLHPSAQLSRAEQICGQFLSLVEMHCREQHRVDWYAYQMCLAPKYLSNVLKQTLNIPPNTYIDQALLRQAKSLLSSTSLSVQQISDRLGFQNQSHFGTFFRRQVGISPAAFRKRT